ncbi:hypothetical protein BB559_002932 [Furculomyces boomerangus]|uniref:C2H2-type domain-containing protein n=2 Tax=Harpellales TaxID=61421 RepID=A0A2T9YR19_9FUNG|nr:hypothetical protein BB559_002932 [Furculomyces boomerangus]PWA01199.1 hypothetical protein BB558_002712 [Smittium angustum]
MESSSNKKNSKVQNVPSFAFKLPSLSQIVEEIDFDNHGNTLFKTTNTQWTSSNFSNPKNTNPQFPQKKNIEPTKSTKVNLLPNNKNNNDPFTSNTSFYESNYTIISNNSNQILNESSDDNTPSINSNPPIIQKPSAFTTLSEPKNKRTDSKKTELPSSNRKNFNFYMNTPNDTNSTTYNDTNLPPHSYSEHLSNDEHLSSDLEFSNKDISNSGDPINGYSCNICDISFLRHHNLKSHLLTHSSSKPFDCEICSKSFRRQHDLKRHKKLHTGERPYSCNTCGRGFARLDALNRHKRTENLQTRSRFTRKERFMNVLVSKNSINKISRNILNKNRKRLLLDPTQNKTNDPANSLDNSGHDASTDTLESGHPQIASESAPTSNTRSDFMIPNTQDGSNKSITNDFGHDLNRRASTSALGNDDKSLTPLEIHSRHRYNLMPQGNTLHFSSTDTNSYQSPSQNIISPRDNTSLRVGLFHKNTIASKRNFSDGKYTYESKKEFDPTKKVAFNGSQQKPSINTEYYDDLPSSPVDRSLSNLYTTDKPKALHPHKVNSNEIPNTNSFLFNPRRVSSNVVYQDTKTNQYFETKPYNPEFQKNTYQGHYESVSLNPQINLNRRHSLDVLYSSKTTKNNKSKKFNKIPSRLNPNLVNIVNYENTNNHNPRISAQENIDSRYQNVNRYTSQNDVHSYHDNLPSPTHYTNENYSLYSDSNSNTNYNLSAGPPRYLHRGSLGNIYYPSTKLDETRDTSIYNSHEYNNLYSSSVVANQGSENSGTGAPSVSGSFLRARVDQKTKMELILENRELRNEVSSLKSSLSYKEMESMRNRIAQLEASNRHYSAIITQHQKNEKYYPP